MSGGADIDGIQGLLIAFRAVLEEGSGVALLGRASKVVKEGYTRAIKAIDTLDEDWNLGHHKVTIQMNPAGTEKDLFSERPR